MIIAETLGQITDKEDKQVENLYRRILRYGDQNTVEGAIGGAGKLATSLLIGEIINCLNKHTSEFVRLACVDVLLDHKDDLRIKTILREIAINDLYESVRKKVKSVITNSQ